jgi:hypothetical protein
VAAASRVGADLIQKKNRAAYRISIKKLSPTQGIKLICGPGPQAKSFYIEKTKILKIVAFQRKIRQFLITLAVHIEGIRPPHICLVDTLCSCQCPFNFIKVLILLRTIQHTI